MKRPPKVPDKNRFVEPTELAGTEFLLYQTEDGQTRIEVRMVGETVWLNLNQMSELFARHKSVVSRHIRNVFDEGELTRQATVANFATVQSEGRRSVRRSLKAFSFELILAVGDRTIRPHVVHL